jgi:hypothetical protein
MCINDMIMFFPGDITHCVSCDAPMLPKWWAARRPPYQSRYSKVPRFHTVESEQGVIGVERWHFAGGGTSGLLACVIGLELGYDEIVLCGIPIDNSGHFFDPPSTKTNFAREIVNKSGNIRGDGRRFWTNRLEEFGGRVKSMSGNTKLILG